MSLLPCHLPVSGRFEPMRLEIWSDGTFPFGLPPDDPTREHPSKPRNPDITNVFYRRGLIEQWGRGTNRIVELVVRAGHPAPEFEEIAGSLVARLRPKTGSINPTIAGPVGSPSISTPDQVTARDRPEISPSAAPVMSTTQSSDPVERLLWSLESAEKSPNQIRKTLNLKHRPTFRRNYLHPAQQRGLIEATIPDKPQSHLQKCRLTEQGRAWLAARNANRE